MMKQIKIGTRILGDGFPTFIIAEIGINHNGNIDIAKTLVDVAVSAGCDAVKFQKRTPSVCVPPDQRDVVRMTPWGKMTYLEYRERIEFDVDKYKEIDRHCRKKRIPWFASCWDQPSVDFITQFDPVCCKIASACLTDDALLQYIGQTKLPIILSTGMSTMNEIHRAVSLLNQERLLLAHSTSSYACRHEDLNLKMIQTLRKTFDCPVGYSGHEEGTLPSCAAVALGACFVERHVTLDRTMWGSDHAASLDPEGLNKLVQSIREIEKALGDGVKRVYEAELQVMPKLRRCL
jgi:N-acetylneuraminate synthase